MRGAEAPHRGKCRTAAQPQRDRYPPGHAAHLQLVQENPRRRGPVDPGRALPRSAHGGLFHPWHVPRKREGALLDLPATGREGPALIRGRLSPGLDSERCGFCARDHCQNRFTSSSSDLGTRRKALPSSEAQESFMSRVADRLQVVFGNPEPQGPTPRPFTDRFTELRRRGHPLSVCSWCSRVRNEAGAWVSPERGLLEAGDVPLTHGVCPECARAHFPRRSSAA
ncbi:hypothetical protein GETHLI_01000 [Geothrix limicola]|uniref:Uncharacterized protein n=1 Tax=Geothrix limicola TaxID=2927978 RepID=A0ABQ5QAI2_9BACT|nr:hypothetical protein GETHLI_01000 [Geothrix limicola]